MKQNTDYAQEIEEIFKKYKNKIYWLILTVVRNENDAQDALQNTFLKAIKNLKNFQGKSLLSTWIYKIAYNEALMLLRKKYSQNRIISGAKNLGTLKESLFYSGRMNLPDKELLDNELKSRIVNAIRAIPLKYRMPVLLYNFQELSLKEAASILNLNLNSFKTRLHRANILLSRDIKDYFDDKLAKKQGNIRCRREIRFIYNYALGTLDEKKQKTFKAHISDCKNCKVFFNTYLKAIRLTKALECPDIPVELEQKIKSFIVSRS